MRSLKTFIIVAAAVVLVAMLLSVLAPIPAAVEAQNVPCFRPIGGAKFVCADGGAFEAREGALIDVQYGASALFGGSLEFAVATPIAVTSGGAIDPDGAVYVTLTSAGNVGTSNVVTTTARRLLILHNTGSNTITLTDTGQLLLGGNAVLGPQDTLTLISSGGATSKWVQLSKADN
jgi:hypothetical protein